MPDFLPGQARTRFVAFGLMCLVLLLTIKYAKAQQYDVYPGEDIHAIVRNAGDGATIRFAPGLYRLNKRIDPLNSQRFIGGEGVILSGAKVLPDNLWQRDSAGRWYVTGQTQEGDRKTVIGETMCESGSPRCNFPELLCVDGVACLNHVDAYNKLVAGAWFFNYPTDTIYMYDDPTGRLVETSVTAKGQTNCAICGSADGVTIRDFTVTQFGTMTESGTLEAFAGGHGWVIENNVIRLNGAVGAVVRQGGIIRGNRLLDNGQAGYGAGNDGGSHIATGIVIENNEIARNNFKRVNPYFSAGCGKAVRTLGLIVRGNHGHHQTRDRCLWTDLDNSETVYENNRLEYNMVGIYHEMGYSATIRINTFKCNGTGADGTYHTSILLTNVSGVLIEANDIVVCAEGNAIGVREDGGRPTRQTDAIDVRGNRVTFIAGRGAAGQDAYGEGGALGRVTWANNVYYAQSATYKHWLKEGKALTFAEWSALFSGETQIVGNPTAPTPTPTKTATAQPIPATLTPTPTMTAEATGTPEGTPTVTPQRLAIRFGGEFWIEVIEP